MKHIKIFILILAVIIWTLLLFIFIRYEANRAVGKINAFNTSLLENYEPIIKE